MSTKTGTKPANEVYRLPPKLFDARCKSCWVTFAILVLIVSSFYSLNLEIASFMSADSMRAMGSFVLELLRPNFEHDFLLKVFKSSFETLAMSALGTILAAIFGLAWAIPASKAYPTDPARWRKLARGVLNGLRAVPELVWAMLLLIALGLGPFAGTVALAFHTTGVLGRLFAECIENSPDEAAYALRVRGASGFIVFWYATFPQVLPQLVSYTLYRWENNIRAAAILGVVGAGGLGQMLAYYMGLFQMSETSTILLAMIILVAAVDALSYFSRKRFSR
ncbi:phosphonate ABC transporter, permease protein PhnE [Limnobacter sp.]|uniref:phosphonate ABC transporter, permease protein PhnE n=1 Tax=Limnobacter sp. TaxID=2003368 RepID=UPI00258D6702|nr:phosphonate ABC transporter, permease protein PhnE [Limnobacter sp.]